MIQIDARRLARRSLSLSAAAIILSGCLPQGETDEPDPNPAPPSGTQAHQVTGSVGDGPIVSASLSFVAVDGADLGSTTSDDSANFDITVETRDADYPLSITSTGGTDLVTDGDPDFVLKSFVSRRDTESVANLNPFTAFAFETARDMSGGVTVANMQQALTIVSRELNSGLTTMRGQPILTRAIDETNIAEVLRASEALGEAVRRVRDSLQSAGIGATGDDVVAAIASDLVDGVIDGRGGPRSNARIAALTGAVMSQVALETMQNNLRVNGSDVMVRLSNVMAQVAPATPTAGIDELPVTPELIDAARLGLLIGDALDPSTATSDLLADLGTVTDGMTAVEARQRLSGDGRALFTSLLPLIASASTTELELANAILRDGSAPSDNAPPVITGTPATRAVVGALYSFLPTASDSDGDALTFSISGLPAWADFDTATGELSGIPAAADSGVYSGITISVSDGQDTASLPAFTIDVVEAPANNTPPQIGGSPATSVTEGQAYSFTPTASDADGDTLTFSISGRPSWASFNTGNGNLSGTPGGGDVGSYGNITITVSDGVDSDSLGPFSITVEGLPNTAPEISGTPATTVNEGQAYSFTPQASDADGDSLTFSISNRPSWASFDTGNGNLSGSPGGGDVGSYGNITITVSDGEDSDSLGPFSISVEAVPNSAPVIGGSPPATVTEGSAYDFTPQSSDADGDSLTFSIVNLPSWASFDTGSGRLYGTPGAGEVGSYPGIEITVSDGEATDTLGPFPVTVEAIVTGSATLTWTPPTQNTDGTALTDLAGYRIYWGTSSGNYTESVQLDNPGLTSYVVENLTGGTWYFVSTAINSEGVESNYSNEAVKTIQ